MLFAFALVAVNVAADEGGLLAGRVYAHSFDIVAVVAGQTFWGDYLKLAEDRIQLLIWVPYFFNFHSKGLCCSMFLYI